MEFVKRSWYQAKAFLEQLTPSQKWLILALLVILGLAGFVVLQYAASPAMVTISQFASDRQGEVISRLRAAGIKAETQGAQVLVPADQRYDALVILQQADLMNEDTSAAFSQLISQQSPWQTSTQNRQAYLLALRRTLGLIIGKMKGIKGADVFVSMPEEQGFGSTFVRPTASVNITMDGSRGLDKNLAEAVAGLVAGSIAELRPQDVVVIDANLGRQFVIGNEDAIAPGETLEFLRAQESHFRQKIMEALGYIPGVRVAVNVRIDSVLRKEVQRFEYESAEPLTMQESKETERRSISREGEPGVRPNTGLSIAGGAGEGTTETSSESRSEFGPKNLTSKAQIREAGQTTKQVNVTVNVPRSYFLSLALGGKADAAEPSESDLEQLAQKELPRIVAQVEPLISAEASGVVRAHMIPDPETLLAWRGGSKQSAGMLAVVQSPWIQPVGLLALALASLALMFGMVRKALQQPSLPSVEELAGIPPTLPMDDDLIGEVEAEEVSMAGVEVDDNELRSRKIAEQIGDMVKANPQEAMALFNRWVEQDD